MHRSRLQRAWLMVSPVNAVFAARDATCSLSRCLWEPCSLLASAAGLPWPVRALEAARLCGEQFCKRLNAPTRAPRVVTHSHQSYNDQETRTRTRSAAVAEAAGARQAAMKRFLDWLKAGGAEFSRLRVTTTARGGRGVVATAAFAPGDVLLRVPEPLLLTVDKAERRPDVAERVATSALQRRVYERRQPRARASTSRGGRTTASGRRIGERSAASTTCLSSGRPPTWRC